MNWKKFALITLQFLLIIIFVFLFKSIFGEANTMVGIVLITGILILWRSSLGMDPLISSIIIFLLFPLIGLVTYITQGEIWIGLLINILTITFLMILTGVKLIYKAYVPFLLGFVFLQGSPVSGEDQIMRMLEVTLGGIIIAVTYYFRHRKDKDDVKGIKEVFRDFLQWSEQTKFTLRLSFGIGLAIVVGQLIHEPKVLWISIVVMSLTQLTEDDMRIRLRYRMFGLIIGSVLFVLLFKYLLPEQYFGLSSIVLGFIYSFINEYKYQQIFTTINALSVSLTLFGPGESIIHRVIMLGLGTLIVILLFKIEQWITPVFQGENRN